MWSLPEFPILPQLGANMATWWPIVKLFGIKGLAGLGAKVPREPMWPQIPDRLGSPSPRVVPDGLVCGLWHPAREFGVGELRSTNCVPE